MRPVFIASGPDFQQDLQFNQTISLVHVYPLMCHLLRIAAAPGNGSLDEVIFLTRRPDPALMHDTMKQETTGDDGDDRGKKSNSLSSLAAASRCQDIIVTAVIIIISSSTMSRTTGTFLPPFLPFFRGQKTCIWNARLSPFFPPLHTMKSKMHAFSALSERARARKKMFAEEKGGTEPRLRS